MFSRVYIGSDKQPFDLIFDTGSSWVWVGDDLCMTCANSHRFNHTASDSFNQLSPRIKTLHYGRGTIVGYDVTDQVCLTPTSTVGNGCMQNFRFRDVIYQEALGGLAGAGLVGLAPTTQYSGSQLFVPSLYKQGAIK